MLAVSEFLRHLEASGLLQTSEVAELRSETASTESDAESLAARLVQKGRLTAWQAKHLLAGRAHGFFLGKYVILDPLGKGGMGVVFRVKDPALDRVVAIKVLAPHMARHPGSVRRFQREARAAGRLDHDNVVRVFDVDQAGHTHFIVMEYVAGQNLAKRIRQRGRLSVAESVRLTCQAASGLEHAFQQGITHRDIKPSNILVTPTGTAKILDMGLARFSGDSAETASTRSALTQSGDVIGTVDYMAPEQAEQSHEADTRSDIYSLGCTLYECLTGQRPFPDGSLVQKLWKHQQADPQPIKELVSEVPESLAAEVRRMMAKRPADRHQTPEQVVQSLRRFLEPEPVRPPEALSEWQPVIDASVPLETADALRAIAEAAEQAPFQSYRGRRQQPWSRTAKLSTTLVILATLITIATVVWQRSGRTTLVINWPEEARKDGILEVDGRRQRLPPHGQLHFAGRVGLRRVSATRPGYKPFERKKLLQRGQTEEVNVKWEPTDDTIRWKKLAELREVWKPQVEKLIAEFEVEDDPNVPTQHVERTQEIRLKLLAYSRKYALTEQALEAAAMARRLPWPVDALQKRDIPADLLDAALKDVDAENAPPIVAILAGHTDIVTTVAFSPEGTILATGSSDTMINLWDLGSGNPKLDPLGGRYGGINRVCFSADGTTLASNNGGAIVNLWDLESEVAHVLGEGAEGALACSPVGSKMAAAVKVRKIIIWDTVAKTVQNTISISAGRGGLESVAFSPDGRILVYGCSDGAVADAIGPWASLQQGSIVAAVAFSPDGTTLVSGGKTIKRWNVARRRESNSELEIEEEMAIVSLAFSPDGQTLVALSRDGTVRLWDWTPPLLKLRKKFQVAIGEDPIRQMVISPEGRHLATANADGTVYILRLERYKPSLPK